MDGDGYGQEFVYKRLRKCVDLNDFTEEMEEEALLFSGNDYFSLPGIGMATSPKLFAEHKNYIAVCHLNTTLI